MPTELRAALRDIAENLTDATLDADPEADAGNHEEAHEYLHLAIGPAVKRLRAIADAPPTVAELLPMVDATHAEEWTATGGERMRIRLDITGAQPFHRVECFCVSDGEWFGVALGPDDMNQPATLVEVSP